MYNILYRATHTVDRMNRCMYSLIYIATVTKNYECIVYYTKAVIRFYGDMP